MDGNEGCRTGWLEERKRANEAQKQDSIRAGPWPFDANST